MTKREFLDKLKKALANDLSGNVIRDNVDYYNDYITEEVRKGRKESEVIEELGDPWAIAKNIITSEEIKGNTGETYDSYEPERQRSQTYEQGYDEESGHRGVHVFELDTWWKKLVLLLGIIGVIVLVVAVIGGIISILAPIFVPTSASIPVSSSRSGRSPTDTVPSYLSAVTPLYSSVPNFCIFAEASIMSFAVSSTSYWEAATRKSSASTFS